MEKISFDANEIDMKGYTELYKECSNRARIELTILKMVEMTMDKYELSRLTLREYIDLIVVASTAIIDKLNLTPERAITKQTQQEIQRIVEKIIESKIENM